MNDLTAHDLMSNSTAFITPDATLLDAAAKMAKINCGILPVGQKHNVQGIITDRDIVVRAIAKGLNPEREKVRDHMTPAVYSCKEGDTIRDAAAIMKRHKVGRLAVKDKQGHVTGILSFGHLLRRHATVDDIAEVIIRAKHRPAA